MIYYTIIKEIMKRIILLALFSVSIVAGALSQSMSDSQIIKFIQKEQKAGTSQGQIVTKLMQKGVSMQRLQQIRKKYQNLQKSGSGSSSMGKNDDNGSSDRLRTANGTSMRGGKKKADADFEDNTLGGIQQHRSGAQKRLERDGGTSIGFDEYSQETLTDEEEQMVRELDGFYPDSLTMLKQKLKQLEKKKKKVFGRDIFNNRELTFEPNMNIATPQNYVLGPGDVVNVDIYGASQKTVSETISPDGTITIEDFGPVTLSGLTVSQAKARLRSTLGSRYASSSIQLTVGQTKTMMVNVMGEVKAPGTYTLSAFASVFHALYMAGGTNDIGTLRNIKVYRNGKVVSNVDIYDYILNGKQSGNIRLHEGDVIVVGPYDCLVNISGKVKRPMFYEMKRNESVKTLLQYAGGFTGDAYKKTVRVLRKSGTEYQVFNVSEFDMSSFRISDEDSVSVDSILPRYENMVELRGAALRPGLYQIGGDVTTVKGLIDLADGIKEEALSEHAVMHRMKADRTLEVLSINLRGIMDGTVADVPLRNEDVLFIPSKKETNDKLVLKIYGEVQYPGTYQYADGTTLEDIVLQAGGLKESASQTVKVSRRTLDSAGDGKVSNVSTQTFEMKLKDGFVIDGEPGFVLQPYDEIYVTKDPLFKKLTNVTIEGEVFAEGTFSMSQTITRVSDVLKMCGGITSRAARNGTYIMRKMSEEEKRQLFSKTSENRAGRAYNLASGQSAGGGNDKQVFADSLFMEHALRTNSYKVAVDLQASINNPGSLSDVILRDGDRIIVEEARNTVRISGAVPYENTVPYIEGKNIKYYMAQGGSRGFKDRKWAYIVYQNGTAQMVKDGARVEPGCEIILPERNTSNNAQNTALWISLGSTIATMAAVVVSAMKK